MVQETNLLMEVPKASRPRERLDQFGEKALATHELLAIVLRTGPRDSNVMQLALRVLNEFEDLHSLKLASLEELTSQSTESVEPKRSKSRPVSNWACV